MFANSFFIICGKLILYFSCILMDLKERTGKYFGALHLCIDLKIKTINISPLCGFYKK